MKETIFDLVLYLGLLSPLFIAMSILAWFTERTVAGKRLLVWVIKKLDIYNK